MRIRNMIPTLLGVLLLSSCAKEEFIGSGNVPEDESALMKFSLSASFQNETPQSRATSKEEETKFKDIRVMIFKSTGELVTNYKKVYDTATDSPQLTINTYSGSDRTVYVVANSVDALDKKLATIQTLPELIRLQITAGEFNSQLGNKSLLMTGEGAFNIAPGANDLTGKKIAMKFMVAKLILEVVDTTLGENESVEFKGWDIEDAPMNSFVTPQTNDANKGKEDNQEAWLTTTGETPFDSFDSTKKTAYLTQYLFENRRGYRDESKGYPPADQQYPNMDFQDSDPRAKAWYAPKRATCIVIHAVYHTPTESKGIKIRMFIGNDNSRNYDIRRGDSYKFTIKIKDIKEVNIDSNIEFTQDESKEARFAVLSEQDEPTGEKKCKKTDI